VSLEEIRRLLPQAVVALDFDGSVSPIVARPQDARPLEGFGDVFAALAPKVRRLAVVTGRPSSFVRERLPVDGVEVIGLYGLADAQALSADVLEAVSAAAATAPGSYVEDKGMTVAVHLRGTEDPDDAERGLRPLLASIGGDAGLVVLQGKRVLELAPPGGGKGEVVRRLATGAAAVLFAGDDVADLDAFDALDGLDAVVCRVAVLGLETPEDLRLRADVAVDGPEGLLELLRSLV
jgi:trehalose 6-phosphate phosphatase